MTNSSSDDEYKAGAVRQEKFDATPHYADTDVDGIEEKRIVRKIDWRLLPILGALYSISLVSSPRLMHHLQLKRLDRPHKYRQRTCRRHGRRPRAQRRRQIHHRSCHVLPDVLPLRAAVQYRAEEGWQC